LHEDWTLALRFGMRRSCHQFVKRLSANAHALESMAGFRAAVVCFHLEFVRDE
jgi:hypothetical protein